MRLRSIVFVATIITLISAITLPNKNFSGGWMLNIAKSDFGNLSPDSGSTAASLVRIIQESESLKLSRIFPDKSSGVELYKFDGSTIDTTISEIYHKSSSLKWADNGYGFTIQSDYDVRPPNGSSWKYSRTEEYNLSGDDKILTINRITVMPDRTETVKAVYDKQ